MKKYANLTWKRREVIKKDTNIKLVISETINNNFYVMTINSIIING